MDYTIITPVEKAAMAAVPKGQNGFPWLLLVLGAVAFALLGAFAYSEYLASQSKKESIPTN